jgi:hypothetical protein
MRLFALLLVLVTSLATVPLQAQRQLQFFMSVVDAAGQPLDDIKTSDLVVTEDGVPASITKLEPLNWPVKITVLVDNGLGTQDLLVQWRNGLKAFFNALPIGVESSLLTLAPQPRWIVRPTNDRVQLTRGVDRITPDQVAARFVDGLIEFGNRVEQENTDTRRHFPILLVLGTTGPEGSSAPERDIQRMFQRFDRHSVSAHIVMLTTAARTVNEVSGARQVIVGKAASELTGGIYEAIAAQNRITPLLTELGDRIAGVAVRQAKQYRVTIDRPGTGPQTGQMALGVTRPGISAIASIDGRISMEK